MKRSVAAAVVLLVASLAPAQQKPVITVLDFKSSGVSEREMKSIISLLSNALFKTGKYTIIDVEERQAILREIEFSTSDCVDEKCQLEIGKQLAAEMIVVGSIDKVGSNIVVAAKMLETRSGRATAVADGVYRDLDQLLQDVGKLSLEIAAGPALPAAAGSGVVSPAQRSGPPPELILVKAGSFRMGFAEGDADERPVHRVSITRSFYMSQHEVTQRQWREVMATVPSKYGGDDLPVENVTWYEAVEYCNRLSRREGLEPCYSGSGDGIHCDFTAAGYRLPSEAEWEYAARGGSRSKGTKYAGSDSPERVGWYSENSGGRPHAVGQKPANELGLYDMSGNVREWCWDWFGAYGAWEETDPSGPETGPARIYRGGAWNVGLNPMRSTGRDATTPAYRGSAVGFRVVRTAQ